MDNEQDSRRDTSPIIAQAFIYITKPPFNAVGDGVTDDAPALQAAVNASRSGVVRLSSDEASGIRDVCQRVTARRTLTKLRRAALARLRAMKSNSD